MLPLIGFWSGVERAWARKRMLLLYWLLHTLCALAAALPAMAFVVPQLKRSRLGDELMRQFDLAWLAELTSRAGDGAVPAAVLAGAAAGLILLIGSVYLAGGSVPMLANAEAAWSQEAFWRSAGKHFWRFLRLSLYALIPYAAALFVAGLPRRAAEAVWGEGLAARPLVLAGHVRLALLIVLFGLISTAMDFARVRLVLADSRQSLRACLGSLRLVLRHPGVIFWLWACFGIAWAALSWGYVRLAGWLEQGGVAGFVALVPAQQAYVLARIGLRFAAWGAAAELDPILRPLPAPEPPPAQPEAAPAPDYQI